jgi:hypothetical protein
MSQPTRQHRHDIHPRMTLSFGVISGLLWQEAIDTRQPVGTCTACGALMRPEKPEQRGRRMFYPARCSNAACGREVEGQGPRVAKAKTGGDA